MTTLCGTASAPLRRRCAAVAPWAPPRMQLYIRVSWVGTGLFSGFELNKQQTKQGAQRASWAASVGTVSHSGGVMASGVLGVTSKGCWENAS